MRKIWNYIKASSLNLVKIFLIALLFYVCYNNYVQLIELKEKNDNLSKEIDHYNQKMQLLKKTYQLYDDEKFLTIYLLKTYGLSKNKDLKLYIVEVK